MIYHQNMMLHRFWLIPLDQPICGSEQIFVDAEPRTPGNQPSFTPRYTSWQLWCSTVIPNSTWIFVRLQARCHIRSIWKSGPYAFLGAANFKVRSIAANKNETASKSLRTKCERISTLLLQWIRPWKHLCRISQRSICWHLCSLPID